jgi:AcrR family transcriptional regulator
MQRSAATRPGGRSTRVRDAVIAATLHELAGSGYRDLSMEAIAVRAGVNKSTLYRRWDDLDGLLAEVLATVSAARAPIPDTGSLSSDLRQLAIRIARVVGDPVISELLRGLAATGARKPAAAPVLLDFVRARTAMAMPVIEQAIARGELPAGVHGFTLLKALVAPFFLHLLITGEPVDEALAVRSADAACAAARQGIYG